MDRSPRIEQHLARGARAAERPEAPGFPSPSTFGDVPREYRAARDGCALFDAGDRGLVVARGSDAADFLHRILANHVLALPAGGVDRNLLLTSKGKVRFAFDLVRWPERFELSTPPGAAPNLRDALETYHFSESLSLELETARHAPAELVGPEAGRVIERAMSQAPPAPGHAALARWNDTEVAVVALALAGSAGFRVDAGAERAVALWEALERAGATPAGLAARDCLRVEQGAALWGLDVDDNVYPQEAGLDTAFALDKGCYVGQEVVAKIDTYGGLNKRLVALAVDHSDPVARGTALVLEEAGERRELGLVTSWAYSFELDTGLVLGYVKRHHQEPGTVFALGDTGGRATIVPVPVRSPSG